MSDIIRMILSRGLRVEGYALRMGEMRNTCKVLVGNPEGKGFGRPR
jgi:hypothetical protein